MYSLLIVDDEKWVRQGLRSTIDWQAEGIEVLGEAEDGEEALRLIKLRTPDIIITDIKMPRMDGLALIEAVKNSELPAKIIIISGYSDFKSAQKAIRCGASDYVLKPIEETQVLDVVRKCVMQINREQREHYHFTRMTECMRESLPLARQRYLETLLTRENTYVQNWRMVWDRLSISLDPSRLHVINVEVHDWGSNANDPQGRSLLRYALGNIAEELGAIIGQTMTCPLDHHEHADLVILISPNDEQSDGIKRSMESLIHACRSFLRIGITIGISEIREWTKLRDSFQEAVHAGAYAFYEGYGKVYDAAGLEHRTSEQLQPYVGPSGWDTRFIHAVKLGKEALLTVLIDELTQHLQSCRRKHDPHHLRSGLAMLLSEIDKKLDAAQASVHPLRKRLYMPYCTLPELADELMKISRQIGRDLSIIGSRKRCIELAIAYIQDHFTEEISMNGVAEQHYLNASYFSKIFHEETGETFSKYIMRLRIEKAKNLLKDSSLKIYEVAQQVGYQDFRHFIKLFKDQEGITPAQYRDFGVM